MHIVSFILERLCCVIVYGHGSLMVQTTDHSPLPLAFHLLHHAFSLVTVLWIAYAERLYDSRAVYKNDFVQLDETTVIPVGRNCAENPWIKDKNCSIWTQNGKIYVAKKMSKFGTFEASGALIVSWLLKHTHPHEENCYHGDNFKFRIDLFPSLNTTLFVLYKNVIIRTCALDNPCRTY